MSLYKEKGLPIVVKRCHCMKEETHLWRSIWALSIDTKALICSMKIKASSHRHLVVNFWSFLREAQRLMKQKLETKKLKTQWGRRRRQCSSSKVSKTPWTKQGQRRKRSKEEKSKIGTECVVLWSFMKEFSFWESWQSVD